MNWHVFKKDDPSTYPEVDCPMLVCKHYKDELDLDVHSFDSEFNQFYKREGTFGRHYKAYDECFYAYVGYVPSEYKVHHPVSCGYVDENGDECACPYGFDDDGYCICDKGFECEHQVVRNEYEVIMRRTWKEFV